MVWTHKEYDKDYCWNSVFDTTILIDKTNNHELKVLKTEEDYNSASIRMMEINAEPNTPEGDELDLLIALQKIMMRTLPFAWTWSFLMLSNIKWKKEGWRQRI